MKNSKDLIIRIKGNIMLDFVKRVFKDFLEIVLWLNLILCTIIGGIVGNIIGGNLYGITTEFIVGTGAVSFGGKGVLGAVIGVIIGLFFGLLTNIIFGGFIASGQRPSRSFRMSSTITGYGQTA